MKTVRSAEFGVRSSRRRRKIALMPCLRALFDFRSAEERRLAVVQYDPHFAEWQKKRLASYMRRLRESVEGI